SRMPLSGRVSDPDVSAKTLSAGLLWLCGARGEAECDDGRCLAGSQLELRDLGVEAGRRDADLDRLARAVAELLAQGLSHVQEASAGLAGELLGLQRAAAAGAAELQGSAARRVGDRELGQREPGAVYVPLGRHAGGHRRERLGQAVAV